MYMYEHLTSLCLICSCLLKLCSVKLDECTRYFWRMKRATLMDGKLNLGMSLQFSIPLNIAQTGCTTRFESYDQKMGVAMGEVVIQT